MKWKIVVDSSATTQELPKTTPPITFEVIPFYLQLDDETIIDSREINFSELFEKFEVAEKASTACPSPATFAEAFKGEDNVICITITGELSGSYNSAVNGREIALEENPNQNIFVFDSKSAGPELDLLVDKVVSSIEEHDDFDQVVEDLKAHHQKTRVAFILQSVDNLVTNGRVSRAIGSIVGLLNLRLVGIRSDDGKIEMEHRVRGNARGIRKLLGEMSKEKYSGGRVIISEHLNPKYAEEIKQAILKKYPEADINIRPGTGLTAFYAEKGGVIVGYEHD